MAAQPPPPKLEVKVGEPLPGDDWYVISGRQIIAIRDGKMVMLTGTEAERARWVINKKVKP